MLASTDFRDFEFGCSLFGIKEGLSGTHLVSVNFVRVVNSVSPFINVFPALLLSSVISKSHKFKHFLVVHLHFILISPEEVGVHLFVHGAGRTKFNVHSMCCNCPPV